MPFRFNARHVFLTYPQCNLDTEVVRDELLRLDNPKWIRVAREQHADGHFHIHAVMGFNAKKSIRSERHWDLQGFHPNIVSPNCVLGTLGYVAKDGNYIDHGPIPNGPKRGWEDAVACETQNEFWDVVKEVSPKDYVINHERLEYYANKRYKAQIRPYVSRFPASDKELPRELDTWVSESLQSDVSGAPSPPQSFYILSLRG